jgi:hypothetical protein
MLVHSDLTIGKVKAYSVLVKNTFGYSAGERFK